MYLTKFIKNFTNNDVFGLAAQTAFFLVISVFPLIMFIVSILSRVNLYDYNEFLAYIFPESVSGTVSAIVGNGTRDTNFSLISIFVSAWSASNAIWHLMKGIHKAYTKERMRSFIKGRIAAVLFTLGFAIAIFVSFIMLVMGENLTIMLNENFSISMSLLNIVRHLVSIGAVFLFILLLYYYTPGCKIRFRSIMLGAAFVAVGWLAASWGFELYIENFTRYSEIYGQIGTFLVLVLWLYVISLLILLGAEINAIYIEYHPSSDNIL